MANCNYAVVRRGVGFRVLRGGRVLQEVRVLRDPSRGCDTAKSEEFIGEGRVKPKTMEGACKV